MPNYQNTNRLGVRTISTVDPKRLRPDISETVRTLYPLATPFLTASSHIGRRKPPQSKKIEVAARHVFDPLDMVTAVTLGSVATGDAAYAPLARLTIDQVSRPQLRDRMYFQSQDQLHMMETGQVVEVVMTENDSKRIAHDTSTYLTLPAAITGNSTTRSAPGTVVVRTLNNDPFLYFTSGWSTFLGFTIYESQRVEGRGAIRDLVWDCNFVQMKDKKLEFTNDAIKFTKNQMIPSYDEWDENHKQMVQEFKDEIEMTLWRSERSADFTIPGRPMYTMMGILPSIRTNIAYYDPSVFVGDPTAMETMFQDWIFDQAFRYNDGGGRSGKFAFAGSKFMRNFMNSFKNYRHTTSIDLPKEVKVLVDTYQVGEYKVALMRNEIFRQDTKETNWCCVLDLVNYKLGVNVDFNSYEYQLANERDKKLVIEWQGTIEHSLEQTSALLRTA